MVCKLVADFMATDPNRTKLVFYVSDDGEQGRHAGYLTMLNEHADHYIERAYPTNFGRAHAEYNDGTDDVEIEGDVFLLEDRRGRRLTGTSA